jgi:DNA modification methylase
MGIGRGIVVIGGMKIRIDPSFKELLRPLNLGERSELKRTLIADGRCVSDLIAAVIRDERGLPLLIDGHHRAELVSEIRSDGGVIEEPRVFLKEFATRFDAIDYVASLQNGRRNWEAQDRVRFILEKTDWVERLRAEAVARRRSGKRDPGTEESQGRVDVQIAAKANVSPTTVKQVRKVLESGNATIIEQLFHPDPKRRMAIAEAAKRVGSAKKAASLQARSERLKSARLPPLPKRSPLDKIICADVLDGLKRVDSESVQLTITSPPYPVFGVPYDGFIGEGKDWYDGDYARYLRWMKQVWSEVYRVTEANGRIVLNIDASNERDAARQSEVGIVHNVYADISVIMREIGWVFRGEHCFYKQNTVGSRPSWGSYAMCSNPRIRRNHEYLLVFQRGTGSLQGDRNLCDLTQDEFEQFTISHWYIKPEQGLPPSHPDFHPVPFPQELVYRCIKLYSYVGATVFDPFVGCGTTAFVAKALNRRYVGVEQSPLYCRSAEKALRTLDRLTHAERLASIKRFVVADGQRADGYGTMQVESIRARARRAANRSRSVSIAPAVKTDAPKAADRRAATSMT